MSISPSLNPGSTSSSSSSSSHSPSQSSISDHGFVVSSNQPLRIFDSPPPPHPSGQVAPAAHDPGGSSKQATDGQPLVLHSLSMKCLLHHYGNYENLPNRISGKILQLETVTQSEAMRRRYRFLSHFSLTTTFQFCEINLRDKLPAESLSPFMDEIKNREKQRKQVARKELKEKIKAEVAESQFMPAPYYSRDDPSPSFSVDDFEALGSSPAAVASSPSSSWPPSTNEERHQVLQGLVFCCCT